MDNRKPLNVETTAGRATTAMGKSAQASTSALGKNGSTQASTLQRGAAGTNARRATTPQATTQSDARRGAEPPRLAAVSPADLHQIAVQAADAHDEVAERAARKRLWFAAAPSWLVSLLVHLALLLVLAAITLDPMQRAISILTASRGGDAEEIEQFELEAPSLDMADNELAEPLSSPTAALSQPIELPELTSPIMPSTQPLTNVLEMNTMTESIMPSSALTTSALAQMSSALNSRSTAGKSELLERYGGTAASEKAVAMALRWLADHQARDGGWTFAHTEVCRNKQCSDPGHMAFARNGATAMALLPFLGAGQTHVEGQYKKVVKDGLAFLIRRMQVTAAGELPRGSWWEDGGRMYSHSLAAITVCEAYAMTQDPDLLQPAQLSLNYLLYAQDKRGGGWRYEPNQPGDTSVVGWCVMALKSGRMGNLVVPPSAFQGADRFLDFVSTNNGAYYGYDKPTANIDRRDGTIAVGLLCRMYLGWPHEHPGLQDGIEFLSKRGPRMNDLYYSYYATQVMRHHGGPQWDKWNKRMREDLIRAQDTDGHTAGSWAEGGNHGDAGGRLYATSLATMILEVYYRHMPLYSEKSSDDEFEI